MKNPKTYYANHTSSIWDIKKGEELKAKGKPFFDNGEFQINTNKGWIPLVFLDEAEKSQKKS